MVSEITSAAVREAQSQSSRRFSAAEWLEYFQQNKKNRVSLHCENELEIAPELRQPLLKSLQRFQIGETGEGKHLRKYAKTMKNPTYEQCIDLFVKEEQTHARMLAELIAGLDGTLLSWHWTDVGFIVLRRMLGLKTELLILLIAEIIGKCFYDRCARGVSNRYMSDAISLIIVDEIAHLQFQCQFLADQVAPYPRALRDFIYAGWAALFYIACTVFVMDHGKTLSALGATKSEFMAECNKEFRRAAIQSQLLEPVPVPTKNA